MKVLTGLPHQQRSLLMSYSRLNWHLEKLGISEGSVGSLNKGIGVGFGNPFGRKRESYELRLSQDTPPQAKLKNSGLVLIFRTGL